MLDTSPNELRIISLGGSLVVPQGVGIDLGFLHEFKRSLERAIARGQRFAVVVGGGSVAREYQSAARELSELSDEDADWLGIHATRLNAHLLRTIFKDVAHPRVFSSEGDIVAVAEPLTIGAGWRPGWSTDYVAVAIAAKLGARRIANLSNTDYVYERDPREDPTAKKLARISWHEYRLLIPREWRPGLNTPFDPVASAKAEELGVEVAIMNGKKLENFERYLVGEKFEGTVIAQ
ncbi:MAG: UMP kinase [bacterium]|nr:UMP kinase [bacterium]MDZ4284632.1 UMP kinase [Patescibacteria group bacterium]